MAAQRFETTAPPPKVLPVNGNSAAGVQRTGGRGMTVVLDLPISLSYHLVTVMDVDGNGVVDYGDAFAGQRNGICGAGLLGTLLLQVGLHTGHVPFRIEVLAAEGPPLTPDWEDVVEVSVELDSRELLIAGLMSDGNNFLLPYAGSYRVRYAAAGMDAGFHQDAVVECETSPDRYLLQWWPAPTSEDAVVRVGSRFAAEMHAERSQARMALMVEVPPEALALSDDPALTDRGDDPAAAPRDEAESVAAESWRAPTIPERFGSRRQRHGKN